MYLYGPESNAPAMLIKGGQIYKVFTDPGLDSIHYIVNTNSSMIAQEIEYDEYGNIMKNTVPDFQPLGFAGGLYDADTKLIRFGARDYDPTIGRWTAKDPIDFKGGDTNIYAYVGGNPMSKNDPSGLTTVIRYFTNNMGHIAVSVNNSPFIGFYPDNSALGLFYSSHGQIKNDSLRTDVGIEVTVNTSPEQEKAILAALLQNNGKPYTVNGLNCATRAAKALAAGDINSDQKQYLPIAYILGLLIGQKINP